MSNLEMPESPIRVCGVSENLLEEARRRQAQWVNKKRLKWYVADRLTGISLEVLTAAYAQAFDHWQGVCGLVFSQTMNQAEADFIILTRKIDGSGGVLAEHELPMGDNRTLRGWFDLGERWTTESPPANKIDLVAVATHEFGHGLGLPHTQQPGNLLNPYYDPRIRTPQSWDIAQVVARYGPPIEEPPPADPPFDAPERVTGALQMFGTNYLVEMIKQ